MNIVLTNDDGFDAPGLRAAYNAMGRLGKVHVVAPQSQRSACSHMITLHEPIEVHRRRHDLFGSLFVVSGTPADCVRLAYAELIPGPIDMVVSGINHGANAGVDVFYSGTIAGAREGAILGLTSISLSQALRRGVETDWSATEEVVSRIVPMLVEERLPGPGFWSVNLPAPLPTNAQERIHRVPVATHPMPMTFERSDRGDGHLAFRYGASYWTREEEGPTDYSVIRDGGIAVTAIPLHGRF